MTRQSDNEFDDLLTRHQRQLLGFIISMLGDRGAARDVLQETNRVLLEKRVDFTIGTSFSAWATKVAKFQTLAWLRDQKRKNMIPTPEIIELFGKEACVLSETDDELRQAALNECLNALPQEQRELIRLRYRESLSLSEIAARTGKTDNVLKQQLFRIRKTIAQCVESRLEP